MGSRTSAYTMDTTAVGAGNYGMVVIAGAFKLNRVEVRGAVTVPGADITDTDWFLNPLVFGIQAIPNGDTPFNLPGDINESAFLAVESRVPGDITSTWAPNTDTAAVLGGGGISLTWAGQQFFSGATEFLFSTGLQTGGSGTWLIGVTMSVWWT